MEEDDDEYGFDEYFSEVLDELAVLVCLQSPDLCMDQVYPSYVKGLSVEDTALMIYNQEWND